MFKVPEKYRIKFKNHPLASDESYGNNGGFKIPLAVTTAAWVIASDGNGWEHVSAHVVENGIPKTPTWGQMSKIKALFWDEEDTVIQYHPPKSEYVNNHQHVLHLWRPAGIEIPMPDPEMVGIK